MFIFPKENRIYKVLIVQLSLEKAPSAHLIAFRDLLVKQ